MHPIVYISEHGIQDSQNSDIRRTWDNEAGLPDVADVLAGLEAGGQPRGKIMLLIADHLMFPLRIKLDEKVAARELKQFLLWRLKRFVPYPIDQVAMRYVPLIESNSYLTYTLPQPWVDGVYQSLMEKGMQCGFIGGVFGSLLENAPHYRGRMNLAFFNECYIFCELDGKGRYLTFRTRKLPLDETGNLDLNALLKSDFSALLGQKGEGKLLHVTNFGPALDSRFGAIAEGMRTFYPNTEVQRLDGTVPARFTACHQGGRA